MNDTTDAQPSETAAGAPAGAAPPAEADGFAVIEKLNAENAELKDRVLRALAEMENLRRRTEREVADARLYGVSAFAREMLAVADNLARALDSVPAEARANADSALKGLIEGVELTARDLKLPSACDIETEDVSTLDLAAVEEEADRCLNCACIAVNVSDLAPALIALDTTIRTTKRVIGAEGFFAVGTASTTVLDSDELVTELEIPLPAEASIQRYGKFRIRHSIDFAIVSVASVLSIRDDKIGKAAVVLGAVAPVPLRAAEVERYLVGREPDTETAEAAGAIAVRTACPAPKNAFKAQIVKAMLREAILDLPSSGSGSPSSR